MVKSLLRKIYRLYRRSLVSANKFFFCRTVHIENEKIIFPLVSVVIPCFNYGHFVQAALESVDAQTLKSIEIIVVDGGSTDQATTALLESIKTSKIKIYFRNARYLVGDNRNYGIERSNGKYICCLDADDQLLPTYLEKAVFFAETYNYDIVYPEVQCFGDSFEVWAPWDTDLRLCAKGATIPTVAIFKREAWERVGGYRDWGVGASHVPEDWDFWLRLLGAGFRVKRIPEPLMLYRVHGAGLTATNRMRLCDQRKKIIETNKDLFSYRNAAEVRKFNRVDYSVENPFVNLMRQETGKTGLLLALPFMVTGGADEVMLRIMQYLERNGFAISCITTIPTDPAVMGDNAPRYRQITPDVFPLHSFLPEKAERKKFVEYLIETRRIKVIFVVGCSFLYQMIPEIKTKYPHVKIVDQLFNPFGHIINNRRYARLIDLNIVANDGIERVLVAKFHEKRDKVQVIIHGVDVREEFVPERFQERYPRHPEWKREPDDVVVGFFGRFSREKGPVRFVEIAERLRTLEGVTWLMTGSGPEAGRVKARIAKYGLEEAVLAPGIVADVKPYLAAADVVVIPSLIEGIPIILMEAMSLGIPVVASKVGGIPDVIIDGVNGFLCDSGDIAGFSARVQQLCEDRQLRMAMGEKAREHAVHHLDVNKMLDDYHHAFARVVNSTGSATSCS